MAPSDTDMDSAFDPNTFLQTGTDEALQTEFTPIPEGKDYDAHIDDVKVRQVDTKNGKAVMLDLEWLVHRPDLAEQLGLKELRVKQGLFLDFEHGRLAIGPNKNVQLGRVREALGQNTPGAWNFGMLKGAGPAKIDIALEPDKKDPEVKYNRVKAVKKAA